MNGQNTGVAFTNLLSPEGLAGNQILEIGSGVAMGDVDGDGLIDLYFCALRLPSAWSVATRCCLPEAGQALSNILLKALSPNGRKVGV